jgi:hypothetical protein
MRKKEKKQIIRKKCPRINECRSQVTRIQFLSYCAKPQWVNCYWYNQWARTLKKPIRHLQEMAISAHREQDKFK